MTPRAGPRLFCLLVRLQTGPIGPAIVVNVGSDAGDLIDVNVFGVNVFDIE